MGMQLPNDGGRRKGRRSYQPMSDINVTPFVDVMLVLLIVFMVTAPLLTVGVPVELPESSAATLNDKLDPLVVSINDKNDLYIQETKVDLDSLIPKLKELTKRNMSMRIYVRGDHKLKYGIIMKVMGHISEAGFSKVALVAEVPKQKKKR